MSLTEGGISSLTQHLLENPTLQLMAICIPKHRTESLVTASDVQLLLRACSLADDYKLVLVITLKVGKEPRPGYKGFLLRRDRLGMSLDPRMHEPADSSAVYCRPGAVPNLRRHQGSPTQGGQEARSRPKQDGCAPAACSQLEVGKSHGSVEFSRQ